MHAATKNQFEISMELDHTSTRLINTQVLFWMLLRLCLEIDKRVFVELYASCSSLFINYTMLIFQTLVSRKKRTCRGLKVHQYIFVSTTRLAVFRRSKARRKVH